MQLDSTTIKSLLEDRLETAEKELKVADKVNNTNAISGWKFVINEYKDVIKQINMLEEQHWRKKLLIKQLSEEFKDHNFSHKQIENLADLIIQTGIQMDEFKEIAGILANSTETNKNKHISKHKD